MNPQQNKQQGQFNNQKPATPAPGKANLGAQDAQASQGAQKSEKVQPAQQPGKPDQTWQSNKRDEQSQGPDKRNTDRSSEKNVDVETGEGSGRQQKADWKADS